MRLVDSSVWVDYLHNAPTRSAQWLDAALLDGPPALTEPVLMEVLAGLSDHESRRFETLVSTLELAAVTPDIDYRVAADIYRATRRVGRTVRQLNDCLIAAVALRTGATLVHKDVDFEVIAEIFQLDHLSLR
ncbi:MAG: PIN domain nuclease [Nocardioides sp.]